MSRVLLLSLSREDVIATCAKSNVGISVVEGLASGGVRLVCQGARGAETMRRKLRGNLIRGDVVRERFRPPAGRP